MRIDFPDGSFMLSWQKVRAWYNPDGSLKDCEYKRMYKGYPTATAVSEKHVKVRAWLEKQGNREIDLLNQGILKRNLITPQIG